MSTGKVSAVGELGAQSVTMYPSRFALFSQFDTLQLQPQAPTGLALLSILEFYFVRCWCHELPPVLWWQAREIYPVSRWAISWCSKLSRGLFECSRDVSQTPGQHPVLLLLERQSKATCSREVALLETWLSVPCCGKRGFFPQPCRHHLEI